MGTIKLSISDIKIILSSLSYVKVASPDAPLANAVESIIKNINSQITIVEENTITDSFTRGF